MAFVRRHIRRTGFGHTAVRHHHRRNPRRKVQKIVDGDTFKVRNRIRGSQFIRIAGKYSPEKGQRGYSTAKKNLSRIRGRTVTIKPVGRSYGRIVANVYYRRKKLK